MKAFLRSFTLLLSIFLLSSNFSEAAALGGTPIPHNAGYDGDIETGGRAVRPVASFRDGTYYFLSGLKSRTLGALGLTNMMGGEILEQDEAVPPLSTASTDSGDCWQKTRSCLRRTNRRFLPFPINRSDLISGATGTVVGAAAIYLYVSSFSTPETANTPARFLQTTDSNGDFSFEVFFSATAGTVSTGVAAVIARRAWIMFNSEEGREDMWKALVRNICCCCNKPKDRMFLHKASSEEGNEKRRILARALTYVAAEWADRVDEAKYRRTVLETEANTRIFIFYEADGSIKFTITIRKADEHDYITNWQTVKRYWGSIDWLTHRDLRSPTGLNQMVRSLIGPEKDTQYLTAYFERLLHPSHLLLGHKLKKIATAYTLGDTLFPVDTHEQIFLETLWYVKEGRDGRQIPDRVPLFFITVTSPDKMGETPSSFIMEPKESSVDTDGSKNSVSLRGRGHAPLSTADAKPSHRSHRRATVIGAGVGAEAGRKSFGLQRKGTAGFKPRFRVPSMLREDSIAHAETDPRFFRSAASDEQDDYMSDGRISMAMTNPSAGSKEMAIPARHNVTRPNIIGSRLPPVRARSNSPRPAANRRSLSRRHLSQPLENPSSIKGLKERSREMRTLWTGIQDLRHEDDVRSDSSVLGRSQESDDGAGVGRGSPSFAEDATATRPGPTVSASAMNRLKSKDFASAASGIGAVSAAMAATAEDTSLDSPPLPLGAAQAAAGAKESDAANKEKESRAP